MIDGEFQYKKMLELDSLELRGRLIGLTQVINLRIQKTLSQYTSISVVNEGAVDRKFVQQKAIITTFLNEVDQLHTT